jgi:hypothetical protein
MFQRCLLPPLSRLIPEDSHLYVTDIQAIKVVVCVSLVEFNEMDSVSFWSFVCETWFTDH